MIKFDGLVIVIEPDYKDRIEKGIAAGTKFSELPDDFECELCGVDKDNFTEEK